MYLCVHVSIGIIAHLECRNFDLSQVRVTRAFFSGRVRARNNGQHCRRTDPPLIHTRYSYQKDKPMKKKKLTNLIKNNHCLYQLKKTNLAQSRTQTFAYPKSNSTAPFALQEKRSFPQDQLYARIPPYPSHHLTHRTTYAHTCVCTHGHRRRTCATLVRMCCCKREKEGGARPACTVRGG